MSTKNEKTKAPNAISKRKTIPKTSLLKKEGSSEEIKPPKKTSSKKTTEEKIPTSTSRARHIETIPKTTSSTRTKPEIKKITTKLKNESKNREVPLTPPSSRVKKTQYFPTKNLYSNALKSVDMQSKLLNISSGKTNKDSPRIKKQPETDKPRSKLTSNIKLDKERKLKESLNKKIAPKKVVEVKQDQSSYQLNSSPNAVTRSSSPESSSISDRPRTATLRKGSIVNDNIVGPEAPQSLKTSKQAKINEDIKISQETPIQIQTEENYDDYEDDFESYESDFEAYSSSDDSSVAKNISKAETSSASSSAEDTSDKADDFVSMQSESKRISSAGTDDERKLDSGTFELPEFKHIQILEHIKESVEKEYLKVSKQESKERTNLASLSDEGFEDQKSLQFINFADARKRHQKRKNSQIRKKRGEEILNMIKLNAINFTLLDLVATPYDEYIKIYGKSNSVQTSVQTGDDDISEETQTDLVEVNAKWTQMPATFSNFKQQTEFSWENYKHELLGVGHDQVQIKEDEHIKDYNENRLLLFLNKTSDIISELLMEDDIKGLEVHENTHELPFSEGYLEFDTTEKILENTKVVNVSIFTNNIKKILTIHSKYGYGEYLKSIICIWDLSRIDMPQIILTSYGEISCANFSTLDCHVIFAGQHDGTISVWDANERNRCYDKLSGTPMLSTSIGTSHISKIISIQNISKGASNIYESSQLNEICSLDEEGTLIVWNLYSDSDIKNSTSDLSLIKIIAINLQNQYPELADMLCIDLLVENGHACVSTSYGIILHCSLDETRHVIQKFTTDANSASSCLERCPFSSPYFISGSSNGSIGLYSMTSERPLMVLRNSDETDNISIQIVRWSTSKPLVLYAKDSKNNIHIWDLGKSDMFPEYSIPFKQNISCLKLSTLIDAGHHKLSYMIIGTDDGKVYLHLLNKEYSQQDNDTYKDYMKTFLNYVNRL